MGHRTIVIYGAGDSLIEVEGQRHGEPDEIHLSYKSGIIGGALKVAVPDTGEGLFVFAQYGAHDLSSTWMIGISQIEEGSPLPDWPMRWSDNHCGYSVQMEIDAPDEAVITLVAPTTDWQTP